MFRYTSKGVKFAAATAVALAMFVTPVAAQDVANGSATATVLAALVVTAPNALAFGNVYQGVAKTVANTTASAGVFTITGAASATISIYMQLPEFMATASGDDRMTIRFSPTDGSVDSTVNVDPTSFGAGWQNIDPHSFPAATMLGGGGQASIFLGGRVTPSVNQKPGAYSADIILTVAYTGA